MVDLPFMVASLPLGQQGDDTALQIGGGTLPAGNGSLASPAEPGHATRSDMTKARTAMMPPPATVVATQALGSSRAGHVRRKVSSFSGTGAPSHIA